MTPAFGFSVGDFINTINLIRKISKALKETGGASSEYQDAVLELRGLKHALQHLEAIEPTEDNAGYVNAIRGMALACKIPLQEFMAKLDKYEASLGPWAHRSSVGGFGRKTKWALSFGKEVDNLRAIVAAKQISINLLLGAHTSFWQIKLTAVRRQTLSSLNHRTKEGFGASKSRDDQHKAAVERLQSTIEHSKDAMDITADETKANLHTLSDQVDSTNTSIASLASIGDQILAFVRTFPQEIRERLQAITQADWRTYQAVLRLQESISRAPTSLHDSDIQFTNALGEFRSLPFEHFCHWETFEGLLRAQFKDKLGEAKVFDGSFHIIDKPAELESALDRVTVSEEAVARQQVEEDMRLYGVRPEPSDASGRQDHHHPATLTKTSSKREASAVGITDEFPSKTRKTHENDGPGNQALTAMDWNSGASPLDAWLNQSAVPSVAPSRKISERTQPIESLIAQEIQEVKNFRSVHLATSSHPKNTTAGLFDDKDAVSLRQGAQIYYRNIKDKFAMIPTYLALRLAEANFDRATALRKKKHCFDRLRTLPLDDKSVSQIRTSSEKGDASTSRVTPDVDGETSPWYQESLAAFNLRRTKDSCAECCRPTAQPDPSQQYIGLEQPVSRVVERYFRSNMALHGGEEIKLHEDSLTDVKYKRIPRSGKDRKRLPLACIACRRKKIRCSGDKPACKHCLRSRIPCVYKNTMRKAAPKDSSATPYSRDMFDMPESSTKKSTVQSPYELPGITLPTLTGELPNISTRTPRASSAKPSSDGMMTTPISKGFWSGGPPSRRPSSAASIHSRSSSMNSSLHDSPKPDVYQQEDFVPSSPSSLPRGLPAPPVDLKKHKQFNCDLCGDVVRVERRRQWQDHVMSDLRPYSCTFEDCSQSAETYASRELFMDHELESHVWHGTKCPFCGEHVQAAAIDKRGRGRHVGRHMEEIAFTVVPKPYEDWEFYSDSSKESAREPGPDTPAHSETMHDFWVRLCREDFARYQDSLRRKDTVHKAPY
ncbi:MAG: hypothetical protein Q9168_004141 [Polycauliona sp. 1 TL-2023]